MTVDELRELIKLQAIGDYRGGMLLKEIEKAAPMAGTPAALELEDLISAMEAEAPAAPEAAPTDGAPAATPEPAPDIAPLDAVTPPEPETAAKTLDLQRWERKALKALKAGRSPAVAFTPDALTPEEADAVRDALALAQTPDDVRAACKAIGDDLDAIIDDELAAALAWAKAITDG
jgi:hypothetical protein